ncbi:hypothetical protein Esti_000607 [Eimeria stiedai]
MQRKPSTPNLKPETLHPGAHRAEPQLFGFRAPVQGSTSALFLPADCWSTWSAEVEETLNRIKTHKGVRGVIVLGGDGAVLRSSFDSAQTAAYAGAASQLTQRARSLIRDLDPQNDVTFLRVRSKKHEILVAPDGEFLLLVVQDPNSDAPSSSSRGTSSRHQLGGSSRFQST